MLDNCKTNLMSNIKLVLQFIKRRSWFDETHFPLSTALGEQGPHHPHPQVPQPLPSRYAKVCCTTTKLYLNLQQPNN